MGKIRFYLDEGVNIAVAAGLLRRGVSALTTRDAGAFGLTDIEQLDYASSNGLVIVTHDDDFILMSSKRIHKGIVYVHQSKYSSSELIRRLKLLWDIIEADEMKNHIEFL